MMEKVNGNGLKRSRFGGLNQVSTTLQICPLGEVHV